MKIIIASRDARKMVAISVEPSPIRASIDIIGSPDSWDFLNALKASQVYGVTVETDPKDPDEIKTIHLERET